MFGTALMTIAFWTLTAGAWFLVWALVERRRVRSLSRATGIDSRFAERTLRRDARACARLGIAFLGAGLVVLLIAA